MSNRLLLLALCALLCVFAARPVLAETGTISAVEEDAPEPLGLIETTPANWPQPIYLPDYGELAMVGYEGATREDVSEPFDFEWYYDAPVGSGDISLIQGFFVPDESEPAATVWEDYDAEFSASLADIGVEIVSSDIEAWYGGRRWLLYELYYPNDEDPESPIEMLTLANLDGGGLTFLNFFYDVPANEDMDAMLSLITGGPDAPQ